MEEKKEKKDIHERIAKLKQVMYINNMDTIFVKLNKHNS